MSIIDALPQDGEGDVTLTNTIELQRRLLNKTKTDKVNALLKKSNEYLY